MIQTHGWRVTLKDGEHRIPSMCASCCGPSQTSVLVQASKIAGEIRTTLVMKMPYCRSCGARVVSSGERMMTLFAVVTILSLFLPLTAALGGGGGILTPILTATAAVLAVVLSIIAALSLTPRPPELPATSRDDAVSVVEYTDAKDIVLFCTNSTFAERLAAANDSAVKPSTKRRWVESGAVAWSLVLGAGLTYLSQYYVEHRRPVDAPSAIGATPGTGAEVTQASSAKE